MLPSMCISNKGLTIHFTHFAQLCPIHVHVNPRTAQQIHVFGKVQIPAYLISPGSPLPHLAVYRQSCSDRCCLCSALRGPGTPPQTQPWPSSGSPPSGGACSPPCPPVCARTVGREWRWHAARARLDRDTKAGMVTEHGLKKVTSLL